MRSQNKPTKTITNSLKMVKRVDQLFLVILVIFLVVIDEAKSEGFLKLSDGSGPHEGNVKVFVDGSWGFVCDDGFGFPAADRVCRELGYTHALRFTRNHAFGRGQEGWQSKDTKFVGKSNCTTSVTTTTTPATITTTTTPPVTTTEPENIFLSNLTSFNPTSTKPNDNLEATTTESTNIAATKTESTKIAATETESTNIAATETESTNIAATEAETTNSDTLADCLIYGDPDCGATEVAGVVCARESDKLCSPDQFTCNQSYGEDFCIPRSKVCDNDYDMGECIDNSDEARGMCEDVGVTLVKPDKPPFVKLPLHHALNSLPGAIMGTVYVKYKEEWGTVCDHDYTLLDAKVICRALGLPSTGWVRALTGGYRDVEKFWVETPKCVGEEENLQQCPNKEWGDVSWFCDNGTKAAGVFCYGQGVDVRLRGGYKKSVGVGEGEGVVEVGGRVEVMVGKEWRAPCDTGFDDNDAKVICRQLGFTGDARAYRNSHFGHPSPNDLPRLRLSMECYGSEHNLQNCSIIPYLKDYVCTERDTAGVVCSNSSELVTKLQRLLPEECGLPKNPAFRFLTRLSAKVIGGTAVNRLEAPWLAVIGQRESRGFTIFCGATIISEDFLLTSAYCFQIVSKDVLIVRVGNYNSRHRDVEEQEFKLDKVWIHEHYQELGPRDNDITLIKIQRTHHRGIQFGEQVLPACLPPLPTATNYPDHLTCSLTGWGISNIGENRTTILARTTRIVLKSETNCRALQRPEGDDDREEITSSVLCQDGKGYDGGPLTGDHGTGLTCTEAESEDPQIANQEPRHYIYGITTQVMVGDSDDATGHRAILYTDVRKYLRWILELVERA